MRAPKYAITSTQEAINAGLNGFALTLMAESFADAPEKFGGENVALMARAHNGQEVWFVMTKERPKASDFDLPTETQNAVVTALVAARAFISDELEVRRASYLPNPTDSERLDIEDAQSTLDAVESAMKEEG